MTTTQILLPDDARALSTLPRIDYADAFAVTADVEHTSEQWIRAAVCDAPPSVRRQLWWGWTALGLRLGPPWSSHGVLGWRVTRSDPAVTLLAADSWLGLRGQLLFRSEPGGLLFATFVQLTNPAARAVWFAITPRHQHVVRSLLTHAAARIDRGQPGDGSPGLFGGPDQDLVHRDAPVAGDDVGHRLGDVLGAQ